MCSLTFEGTRASEPIWTAIFSACASDFRHPGKREAIRNPALASARS